MKKTRIALYNNRGNSLVVVMMASAVGAIVMFAMLKMMQTTNSFQKHADLKDDLASIKRHLLASVDCAVTLQAGNTVGSTVPTAVNLSSGNDCDPSSPNYKLLQLRDSAGNLLTAPLSTAPGPTQNTAKMGSWNLQVQCDRINHTLVIKAAITKRDLTFAQDPLTKRVYDFSAGNSNFLFGGPDVTSVKMCQGQLGGSAFTGALFGGGYQVFTHAAATACTAHSGSACRAPNTAISPATCDCPSGYTALLIHEFTADCASYYWDTVAWGPPPASPSACGVTSFVCFK